MKSLTQLFPQRRVSIKALRRTEEQRKARVGYERKKAKAEVKAGTYAEHQKRRRYTGVKPVNNYTQWNRKELAALLLPLTARQISVLLHRSIPAVEQKVEVIKAILLVLEGKVKLNQLTPARRRRVNAFLHPGPHGLFPRDNLKWLIDEHGLRSETFRLRDEFGNIIPTITRRAVK